MIAMANAPNKFLQSDQSVLSCLLQKVQKPCQYALAAEERRYACRNLFSRATKRKNGADIPAPFSFQQ